MASYENEMNCHPDKFECLEDRRPMTFRDIVGQENIIKRLQGAVKNNFSSKRFFLHGPTGAGKSTLAINIARSFFCENSILKGDSCGDCEACRRGPTNFAEYHEWTGADLNQNWNWYEENGRSIIYHEDYVFFIDEAQDLQEQYQKELFRDLEKAKCLIIFATTHKYEINDALLGRFGTNQFIVKRPSLDQAVDVMEQLCRKLKVTSKREYLMQAARYYELNMRLCVDFVFTIKEQTCDALLTEDFLESVIGSGVPADEAMASYIPSL